MACRGGKDVTAATWMFTRRRPRGSRQGVPADQPKGSTDVTLRQGQREARREQGQDRAGSLEGRRQGQGEVRRTLRQDRPGRAEGQGRTAPAPALSRSSSDTLGATHVGWLSVPVLRDAAAMRRDAVRAPSRSSSLRRSTCDPAQRTVRAPHARSTRHRRERTL